jgi:RAVE protein 1 C terminal
MEVIARNEYMAGDNRDPTACSLLYFALGKVKLVHGLWRQAAWHREQTVMLNFLSHDFSEARWRTAALKNAYALLSKQRFGESVLHIKYMVNSKCANLTEYAAAFFLLGGSLKDAVNICIKQLGDFQLAVALARIVEQSNEGPILLEILQNTVLPLAFKDGNRWLGSWAFWLLNRRDLAVRILLVWFHAFLSVTRPYSKPSIRRLFRTSLTL